MPESDERGWVQRRIDTALSGMRYSPYLATYAMDLQHRLEEAGRGGGLAGIARALDECEAMLRTEDPRRARAALLAYLIHHPEVPALGLTVPRTPEAAP